MVRKLTWVLVLVAIGCGRKKAGEGGAAAPAGPATKQQICAELAQSMEQSAHALAAGFKGETLSDEERAELSAEVAGARPDFEKECLAWPEPVFDCLRRRDEGPECTKIIGTATGQLAPDAPAGPAPRWRLELPERPEALVLGDGGVVFVAFEQRVVAVKDGKELWSVAVPSAEELRLDADGALLVLGLMPQVIALDPATGKERWRLAAPAPESNLRAWAVAGAELVLVTADARFFARPPKCAAAKCLRAVGALADEDIDGDAVLAAEGDVRWLVESRRVRGFTGALAPVVDLTAYDLVGGLTPVGGGRAVALVDDELVLLDAGGCRGAGPLALPPPPGRRDDDVDDEDDGCEGCGAPPPGCVVARVRLNDVQYEAPVLAGDVLLVSDGETSTALAAADLAPRWKQKAFVAGRVFADGERVLGVCVTPDPAKDDSTPMALCALGAGDGALRWRTPLGIDPGLLYSTDRVHVARRGEHILAGYDKTLVLLPAAP